MAAPTKKADLRVFDSDSVVADKVCEFIAEQSRLAIKERGVFTIGLSGGSAAKFLCKGLPSQDTDWSKWRVFFCDERHVPFDNPECTFTIYRDGLMGKVELSEDHVFPDSPDCSVEEAADKYEASVRSVFPGADLPRFDLLVLGMGPDGHTCSLFPGHELLQEKTRLIAYIKDSPKPPPERITMTFPVLNNSRCCVFVSCGSGKAEMVKRVIESSEEPPLPASRVQPTSGDLVWFLDTGAARLLSNI